MPNSEKTDIAARGRFQQTISGNLRRKRDSNFGTRKKKKINSFLTGPVLLWNPCSIIFSVVIKMAFSRRKNTTQLHLIPWLRMSADIRPYELMQCCLIQNREIFVCISFYTTCSVFAIWNFILQRIQWIILHRNNAFVTQTPSRIELLTLQPIFLLR